MKIKVSLFAMVLAALLTLTSFPVYAANGVDWGSNVITATGTGIVPPGTRGAQAKALAKRAAIVDAQRQLVEAVNGVQVDAETTVEQMILTSDVVRTRVSGTLKGAVVVSENFAADGSYEVTMALPLFGSGSIAQAVMPKPAQIDPFPTPAREIPSQSGSTSITITVKGGYTGVIIDCRSCGVNPVMSPVIKDTNGNKLYGHKNLDYDMVISKGMASYAHDMSQATRAGSNPLVISAVRTEDHNANPVISVEDGNLMLLENESTGFLSNTAVVFLY